MMKKRQTALAKKEKSTPRRTKRTALAPKPGSPRRKLVTAQEIRSAAKQIKKVFNPEKVILFGAYAYGNPNPQSDVEILVVMSNDKPIAKKNARAASKLFDLPYSLNLLVHTSEEVLKDLIAGNMIMRDIILHGQVLFERKVRRK